MRYYGLDRRDFILGLAATASPLAGLAQIAQGTAPIAGLPIAKPERAGMSSAGLAKLDAVMADYIARNQIQGGVTAVSRNGRLVHLQAHGWFDVAAKTPMPVDALFRMASSTKPVTAVALLQQIERGKVSLDDGIGKYLPELKSMRVLKAGVARPPMVMSPGGAPQPVYSAEQLEPQAREITLRDLATHTSGLNAILPHVEGDTLATYLPRFKDVPLEFQPGTRWAYSPGTGPDLLARVVEITSGQGFEQYIQQHIFDPIGMSDTRHNPSPAQWQRVVHRAEFKDGAWQPAASRLGPLAQGNTTYFDGSGGLKGTARDFLLFYAMLANQGSIRGRRVLRPESVQLMHTDLINGLFKGPRDSLGGMGFGVLVSFPNDPAAAKSPLSRGAFGWNGAFGTHSYADPAKDLAAVLMVQQPIGALHSDFDAAVQAALLT